MGEGHTAPVVNPWSTSNIGSAFAMKIHTTTPMTRYLKSRFFLNRYCKRKRFRPALTTPGGFGGLHLADGRGAEPVRV